MTAEKTIIIIDGDCGFCRRTASYIRKFDKRHIFHITTWDENNSESLTRPNSVIVQTKKSIITEGAAVLFILRHLGGFHRILAVPLQVLPASLLNAGYRFIAKHRYRLAGNSKKEAC